MLNPFNPSGLIYPQRPTPPTPKRSLGVKVVNARGYENYPGQPSTSRPVENIDRPVPASTWTIGHTFGRIPTVAVYDEFGALMIAEVYATDTQVVVVHAQPATGTVVLS